MPPSERKRQQRPRPTDGELDILSVLWRLGPATVREVHEALATDNGYTTTLKQMQVMTEKGLLDRSERFRLGAIKKTAGIDDGEIGAGVLARQLVTLRP